MAMTRPTTSAECDANGWRPIETAPKDGTVILVALPEPICTIINWSVRRVATAYFQAQGHDWVVEGNWATRNHLDLTHWQPLPEPPE